MKLLELVGEKIKDIFIAYKYESGGLDQADCFLVLHSDLVIGIPFSADEEVWIRELDRYAESIFGKVRKKDKDIGIKNQKIVNLIDIGEVGDKMCIELENGKIITEINIAPNGTGHAGLWIFNSIYELEERHGSSYQRLVDIKHNK